MFNKYIHTGRSNKIANRMRHWSGSEFDITFHIVNTGMIQDTQSSTTSCTDDHDDAMNMTQRTTGTRTETRTWATGWGHEKRDESMRDEMRAWEMRWEHEMRAEMGRGHKQRDNGRHSQGILQQPRPMTSVCSCQHSNTCNVSNHTDTKPVYNVYIL